MRLVVDLSPCQGASRNRGIGRYCSSLVRGLIRMISRHDEIFVLLNSVYPEEATAIRLELEELLDNTRIITCSALTATQSINPAYKNNREISELLYEEAVAELKPDWLLITSLFEGYYDNLVSSIGKLTSQYRTAVVLYDLIPLENKDKYLSKKHYRDYYMTKISHLNNADLVCTISDYVAQQANNLLDIETKSIVSISSAADELINKNKVTGSAVLSNNFKIDKPYFLYLSALEERKNFEGLIVAYTMLPTDIKESYDLVLITHGNLVYEQKLRKLVKKYRIKQNCRIIERVNDSELVTFYSNAYLFVFPSFFEGFGLPILEAMMCGTPAIGSNATSIPEVIGEASALFDPHDSIMISSLMRKAVEDQKYYSLLCANAKKQSGKFSWDKTAGKALAAMKNKLKSELPATPETEKQFVDAVRLLEFDKTDLLSLSYHFAQNKSRDEKRIYIDITELNKKDAGSGIQRVTRNLTFQLMQNPPMGYTVYPVYGDKKIGFYRFASSFMKRNNYKTLITKEELLTVKSGDLFVGLDLNFEIPISFVSCFAAMKAAGVKLIFTLYDLIPLLHPDFFVPHFRQNYLDWLDFVCRNSDGIISISKAVMDELPSVYKEHTGREVVASLDYYHNGVDKPTNDNIPNSSKYDYAFSNYTFLMVSTLEPRKGHADVIDAFSRLWDRGMDVNLVIVGKQGWKVERLTEKIHTHKEYNKRLFWFSSVSDSDLQYIYAHATALIFASYAEGFGLPIIEAALHKLPVIVRDIPVFREVAADHAFYFDKNADDLSLSTSIVKWMDLYKSDKHPESKNIQFMGWEDSTRQFIDRAFGLVLHHGD